MNRRFVLGVAIATLSGGFSAAHASDPCAAVVCLSNNMNAPHQCKDAVDGYFQIKEYHRGTRAFDPGATALKRFREVMDKCPDARQTDKNRINAMFGTLEHSPFQF